MFWLHDSEGLLLVISKFPCWIYIMKPWQSVPLDPFCY